MNANKIRPLDIKNDLDELLQLFEICFANELDNRGGDFGEEMRSFQRILPLLNFLGRFSDGFRNMFNGFVWEEAGKIVATVSVQREGNDRTRWEIAMVATHPDYRRQGLARQLITHALEYAKTQGAQVCVLYVLAENTPAYNLYRTLGFSHYDSLIEFKLESLPEVTARPVDGYTIRPMKISEWKTRYEVTCQETPNEVQAFLPVSEDQFQLSALKQWIAPLLFWLQKIGTHALAVEFDGQVVSYMILNAEKVAKTQHHLRLRINPVHQAALAEPMLTLALETLQEYPRQNTLLSVRASQTDLLDLLKNYGFVEIEAQHWLGLKDW